MSLEKRRNLKKSAQLSQQSTKKPCTSKEIPMYPNQLPIFKELSPYSGGIDTNNRWIKLASLIPWEEMEGIYRRSFSKCKQSVIKPGRLMLGLMIGEMFVQTDDRDILEYFHENPYFQYFCGQESFVPKLDGKSICHPSLLSKRRKRLGKKYTSEFERLVLEMLKEKKLIKGNRLALDATVFPINISYPNDVKLLNSTREWACETILRIFENFVNFTSIYYVIYTSKTLYV